MQSKMWEKKRGRGNDKMLGGGVEIKSNWLLTFRRNKINNFSPTSSFSSYLPRYLRPHLINYNNEHFLRHRSSSTSSFSIRFIYVCIFNNQVYYLDKNFFKCWNFLPDDVINETKKFFCFWRHKLKIFKIPNLKSFGILVPR